ncbi:MAG: DUF87 domain-containing protein [Conexivisphaerales archaeon]
MSLTLNLGRTHDKEFFVDASELVTGRTCVIGTSGSGKSYTVGVICEELCKNDIPFSIIDTEGEYSGLKEKYDLIWIGDEEKCDLRWDSLDLDRLAEVAHESSPLILDVSECEEPNVKVDTFLRRLYEINSKIRRPYLVIVEEADRFVPQTGKKIQAINEIARRGRKRGLGLMICSQRPASVDKNILSQCSNQIIGKLVIQNDLESVSQFFVGIGSPKQLTTLQPGTFYVMGNISKISTLIKIRERETKHGGYTPSVLRPEKRNLKDIIDKVSIYKKAEEESKWKGILPSVAIEEIPSLVKRKKSGFIFSQTETVAGVSLVYRRFIEVGIRLITGLLKKKSELKYLLLDGITGKQVILDDGISLRPGFESLIGLNEVEVSILHASKIASDNGIIEVSSKLGISDELVNKSLKKLEYRRLVRIYKVGRRKVFSRLYQFPELMLYDSRLILSQLTPQKDTITTKEFLSENDVRNIVRGIYPNSDVDEFTEFLYPLYKVDLVLNRRIRSVWLDGKSGKSVVF